MIDETAICEVDFRELFARENGFDELGREFRRC